MTKGFATRTPVRGTSGVLASRDEKTLAEGSSRLFEGLAFTDASPKKLRRPAGAYSIRVSFSLRDDVEGNTVAYMLRVTEGREHPRDRRLPELDRIEGSTASGSVSTTLRVNPSSKRVRSVDLWLYGSDWLGNGQWVTRSLKLPR